MAQGHIHTGHQTMPQIQIRDGQLRLAVANCYIDRQKVKLGSKLKEGNFGVVYKARWTIGKEDGSEEVKIVAAKTLKRIDTALQVGFHTLVIFINCDEIRRELVMKTIKSWKISYVKVL